MKARTILYGVLCVALLVATMAEGAKPGWPWSVYGTISVEPATLAVGETYTVSWSCSRPSRSATLDGEAVALYGSKKLVATESRNHVLKVSGRRLSYSVMASVTVTDPQPVPPDPVPPDPVPPPPPPPPPPQPTAGLHVLITGPGPRAVRDLTPDQAAILTSRTLRDWCDVACPKLADGAPAYRAIAQGADTALLADVWKGLLTKAPVDKVSLVAVADGKEHVGPLPANVADTIKVLAEVSGVKLLAPRALPVPHPRKLTAEEWRQVVSATGVVIVNGEKRFLSAKPRNKLKYPVGAAPGAVTLAEAGVRIIPRAEWKGRIIALKSANAGLMALTYGKVPCSDQDGTNYCWAHSAKNPCEMAAYIQGQPIYQLSAASVGGPVSGYSNEGGWPADAVNFIRKTGAAGTKLWPENAISSSYFRKPEVQADYPKHKIVSTIADLGASGKIWDEAVTCVLLGAPISVTYSWWGHAIMMVGADVQDGEVVGVFRNSWGEDWQDKGFFVMPEGGGSNQGTPDDAQAILMVVAQ